MAHGERSQDLNNEILWHENNPWKREDHFLMKWPFVSRKRQDFAYTTIRQTVRKELRQYLHDHQLRLRKALVAPCGSKADQDILQGLADEFYGIDISPKAVHECPAYINKKVGDVRETGYPSDYFDAVSSFQFFHHLHKPGFGKYLKEFCRVLKPGGVFFTFEPGNLYPLGWLMSAGRKFFGNISGLVPDEAPIFPPHFAVALVDAGFKIKIFRSLSFVHPRIPVPIQRAINGCFHPLKGVRGIRQTGFMLIWICQKEV